MQGRNGGWRLAGDGRTDLTGLTSAETQALFLLAGPQATTPELRAALRKLVRALPEPFRERAEAASAAVVHDSTAWSGGRAERPTPVHLDAVQSAVIAGRQIVLGYVAREGLPSSRTVHPLGLATKGGSWYLVADTEAGRRTFRVDRIQSVETTDQPVVRPPGFELADAWKMITTEIEHVRTPIVVRALVDQQAMPRARYVLGTRLRIGMADRRWPGRGADPRAERLLACQRTGRLRRADRSARTAGCPWSPGGHRRGTRSCSTQGLPHRRTPAIDVNVHVGDTSPDGTAVAPVPPLS